jgi:lysophospholipid acyltransferase (LPLAT)-like uncharacterized protein
MVNWIKLSVLPAAAACGVRLLGKTMDLITVGEGTVDALVREGKPIIIAFWHGRQLMMPLAYRGSSASILISQHRDGEIIARIMKYFGFASIRGSSTRGGGQAVRQLLKVAHQGQDLVITPDGPRGPACRVQTGVMYLAKLTGFPIVPLTFACSKKKSFPVGITFKFLFHGLKGCLFGETRFGLHPIKRKMI